MSLESVAVPFVIAIARELAVLFGGSPDAAEKHAMARIRAATPPPPAKEEIDRGIDAHLRDMGLGGDDGHDGPLADTLPRGGR